jgi:hypothetical protein
MTRSELIAKLNAARIHHDITVTTTGDAVHVHGRDVQTKAQEKVITALVKAIGYPKADATDKGIIFYI